jgi:crossover junction endodeoxyribonuclease RuvC
MSSQSIRILGIDPGLQVTGFGVIDVQGTQLGYVASGTVRTEASRSLPERLKVLYEGVREVVARYQPDACSVEIVFVNNNPQTTLLLGQARGCCVTALVSAGQRVHDYTALQLKKAVAGSGRAGKPEVQAMVMRLLKLPGLPGKDAADALGLAITHAHVGAAMGRLRQASTQPGAVVGGNPGALLSGRYRGGRSR